MSGCSWEPPPAAMELEKEKWVRGITSLKSRIERERPRVRVRQGINSWQAQSMKRAYK